MDNFKDISLTENSNFVCMNNNGMIIEQSKSFNKKNCGYLTDIVQKARQILPKNDFINSIEIFFEKSLVIIQDNNSVELNMALIVDNDK